MDQTIGGAIATGTHGSSMRWGSLSSQMLRAKLMLANGTVIEVGPEVNSHLWRAAGVSVGQLGIFTELTLRIRPQLSVVKTSSDKSFDQVVEWLKDVQGGYRAALAAGNATAVQDALFALDETQLFWFLPDADLWQVDYDHPEHQPANVQPNIAPVEVTQVQAMDGPGLLGTAVYAQVPRAQLAPVPDMVTGDVKQWSAVMKTLLDQYRQNGTFSSRR